jgi:hypothetical protein
MHQYLIICTLGLDANSISCWMRSTCLSANPFSCWMRSTRLSANPFSCWMRFYICSQCQPFFMLDETHQTQCQPFFMLDEIFPFVLSASLFSCWMRTLPLKGDHTKLVLEVLKLRPRQQLGEHVCNLILGGHEPEPHCSPLHHILDIVVSDLNMLRPVMEHRFL